MLRAVVVGAGVMGASVAYHLAARGARAAVLEAARPAAGASGATFAWINANGKRPASYQALNVAGMREHRSLADSLGDGSWLHPTGNVEWATADGADALEARVAALQELGYQVERLDRDALDALEPDLRLPATADQMVFFPDEGWVDAEVLVAHLLGGVRAAGGTLAKDRVIAMDQANGAVVVGQGGGRWDADVVVDCAGADGQAIAAMAGQTLPMRPSLGLLAITRPAPVRLGRVVHGPNVYFRPDGAGRVMAAGGGGADHVVEAEAQDEVALRRQADELVKQVAGVMPGLQGVGVESVRVGRRALPADGYPVVGRSGEAPWLYHVITHSGVTLAPLLGRLVAEELTTGRQSPDLAPYRPDRFAGVPAALASPP